MTLADFTAACKDLSLETLRDLVKQEKGADLEATTKADAITEAYALYAESLPAKPAQPPERAKRVQAPAKAKPAQASAKAKPVPVADSVYEGRSRTGKRFHKAGRVFGPKWEPIGTLSADEKAVLDRYAAFISYRMRA